MTLLSCDNLPANGEVLRGLVLDVCSRLPDGDALAAWVQGSVAFPSSMVDRIVPATTDEDRAEVARLLGLQDEGVVVTEPFRQWVVEDAFAAGRPAWERAGAVLTADVAPYEAMKLRMLNGSHSTLAYLGALAGFETVAQAVADDGIGGARAPPSWREDVVPTLAVPDGFDVDTYAKELLERFANPALRHRTVQIAMDGTQKLPQRLLGTIRDRLAAGAEPRAGLPRASPRGCATWRPGQTDDGRTTAPGRPARRPPARPDRARPHPRPGRRRPARVWARCSATTSRTTRASGTSSSPPSPPSPSAGVRDAVRALD